MLLGFGEVMLRLGAPGRMRFRQALPGPLEASFGGGEANVCASLALWGRPVRYLTALPSHGIADTLLSYLQGLGIDVSHVIRRDTGRLGIYFLEGGANQLPSAVTYDRDGSAISLAGPEEYPFAAALGGVQRVHVTGITPSLSENAFRATRELVRQARQRGVPVSCDLNFRKKLWRWRSNTAPAALARQCMEELLPMVDLVLGNEEDFEQELGIHAAGSAVEEGRIDAVAYGKVAGEVCRRFPNIRQVAITLRESLSADHNRWGAMLYDAGADRAHFAPRDARGDYRPYEIRDIVDRVGGGDSFAAALLFALDRQETAGPQESLDFATAASCLKHSIPGDVNFATLAEVRGLVAGQASGRVQR